MSARADPLLALLVLAQAALIGLLAYAAALRLLAWGLVKEYWRTLRGSPLDGTAADVASPE